jgi:DNA-binding response OmpR family regulator
MVEIPAALKRALVVDDEPDLAETLQGYLERDGFEVRLAADGWRAVELARGFDPDVIALDLNLPGLDGLEVCRQVRTFSDCYIVMLTARAEEADLLLGLSSGADDYLTKPFRPRELLARINTLTRRPRLSQLSQHPGDTPRPCDDPACACQLSQRPGDTSAVLEIGALRINPASYEVTLDGVPVELTRTEFDILTTLAARPDRVFTRQALVEAVWGSAWGGDERLADTHIVHIRQKLGDSSAGQRYLRTVRGVGYRAGKG